MKNQFYQADVRGPFGFEDLPELLATPPHFRIFDSSGRTIMIQMHPTAIDKRRMALMSLAPQMLAILANVPQWLYKGVEMGAFERCAAPLAPGRLADHITEIVKRTNGVLHNPELELRRQNMPDNVCNRDRANDATEAVKAAPCSNGDDIVEDAADLVVNILHLLRFSGETDLRGWLANRLAMFEAEVAECLDDLPATDQGLTKSLT